jgi:hypothetical protein
LAGSIEDTAPLDVVDRVPAPPVPARPQVAAAADAGDGTAVERRWFRRRSDNTASAGGELTQLHAQLVTDAEKARMQQHTGRLAVLSPTELRAERKAAEKVRKMRREQELATVTAELRRGGRERKATERQRDLDLGDQLWKRKALAKRTRLLDSTSRLAALHRTHLLASVLLVGVAFAGIAWTAKGVHDALVGPGGNPVAYLVEPVFSLPLLVIMLLQAQAAQWGRKFPEEPAEGAKSSRGKVYTLEGGLLLATIMLNASPVLPGLGTWKDTATLLAHLLPPALILVAVVLHPMVSSFVAGVMVAAYVDPDANETRLTDGELATVELARKINEDWSNGQLRESPTGGPSIRHAMDVYGLEKKKVQRAVDMWSRVYG